MNQFEPILLKAVENLDASTLRNFITKDVDLARVIELKHGSYIKTAKFFITINPSVKSVIEGYTDADLLECLRQNRPDLFNIIVQEKFGRLWLAETVRRLKRL